MLSIELEQKILSGYENPFGEVMRSGYHTHICHSKYCFEFENKYQCYNTQNQYLNMKFEIETSAHSGYCSDNDGTIYTDEIYDNITFTVPESLQDENCDLRNDLCCDGMLLNTYETRALFESFDVITCYCGRCSKTYKVIEIEYINNKE